MNRRLPRLFFLGFLSLLLFACQQEPESTPVVEPDPTPSTLPTPLPPTPSVLPTITHTPQPSPTVEATSTTIVVATSTPTATLLPIAVPYTPGFTTYQLQPPSSQAVLTVLRQMTREQLAQYGQYESSLNYLSLGQFIEADLATFFADGFPEAIHLLGDDFFIEPLPVWFMPDVTEAHAHILQEGFVQYLHQQQHQLHAGETVETEILRFTANTMELDDDLLPEWVVQIDFRVWGSTIFVALDEIESGNYVRLPDSFPTLNGRYYSDWTFDNVNKAEPKLTSFKHLSN